MRVKPAPGRAVRDPINRQLLRPEGREVPANQFWTRRVRDGDVIVEGAPAARNGPPTPRFSATEG